MDNLWTRRTNSSKLSLSTPGNGQADGPASARNGSFSKRFGGDSASHGKTNPFSSITTPGGLASPTSNASSAFGLGSGAFASFGAAKTPKSPGNPFEASLGTSGGGGGGHGSSVKTPSAEKSARDGGLVGAGAGPGAKTIGKPASSGSLTDSKLAGSITSSAGTSTTGGAATGAGVGSGATSVGGAGGGRDHQLRDTWIFWFRPPITKANGYIEYEKTLHPIAACETAEHFFAVYQHLKRPSALPLVSDYHLFKKGIRPIWEDDENKKGGKWIVRLKKGVADRYWEDLLLAVVGDQFGEESDEVCGVVLSVRNGEDILSIWLRQDNGRVLRIKESMKRILAFPPETKIEWKSHDSSIQQRTAIEESRREKAAGSHHHTDKRPSKPQQLPLDDQQQKGMP